MEIREFEQAVLKLAFETDARITTASVAYYLGIPSREANDMLNLLLEEGVLELDSDESGNLFYRVPQDAGGQSSGVADLKRQIDAASGTSTTREAPARRAPAPAPESQRKESHRHGPRPSIEQFLSRADDEDDAPAFSPSRRPVADDSRGASNVVSGWTNPDGKPSGGTVRRDRDSWGGFDDYYGRSNGLDGSNGGVRDRSPQAVWANVATRVASPDASLDSCGSSAMVVSREARCEPRPLPSSRPVIVSCNEEEPAAQASNTRTANDLGWFNQNQSDTGALVPAGEAALSRDYVIDQPEHQPGMALLLSLILPGTGQIYNGEMSKGIMMMVMSFLLWWVLLGWVVHIWSIVDAVVIAERMSRQQG